MKAHTHKHRRSALHGGAGSEALAVISLVALTGVLGFTTLGRGMATGIRGADETTNGTSHRGTLAVSVQAGTAGALVKLAERFPKTTTAGQVAEVVRTAEAPVHLNTLRPVARQFFGRDATPPVVRAWRTLLTEASETHSVLSTELGSAAASAIGADGLVKLFEHALRTDPHLPVAFKAPNLVRMRSQLEEILLPFDGARRVQLMKSLLEGAYATVPPKFVDEARLVLAADPDAQPEMLAELAMDRSVAIRAKVAGNSAVPIKVAVALATDVSDRVRDALVGNPHIPKSVLEILSEDSSGSIRSEVIAHANADGSLIWKMYGEWPEAELAQLAMNPSLPPTMLQNLAQHHGEIVRDGVARNASTSGEILTLLSTDRSQRVRARVAANPNTPSRVLVDLLADPEMQSETTVVSLVRNPGMPDAGLEEFATGSVNPRWRLALASNPNLSPYLLRKLAEGGAQSVEVVPGMPPWQWEIAKDPETWAKSTGFTNAVDSLRSRALANPSTPEDVLRRGARAERTDGRAAVARNPSAPADVLRGLAGDAEGHVRATVAGNVKTPADALRALSRIEIQADAPDYTLLRNLASNPTSPADVLTALSKHENLSVREVVAANQETPLGVLRSLARSDERRVLVSLASNPSAPLDVLELVMNRNGLVLANPRLTTDMLPRILRRRPSAGVGLRPQAQQEFDAVLERKVERVALAVEAGFVHAPWSVRKWNDLPNAVPKPK